MLANLLVIHYSGDPAISLGPEALRPQINPGLSFSGISLLKYSFKMVTLFIYLYNINSKSSLPWANLPRISLVQSCHTRSSFLGADTIKQKRRRDPFYGAIGGN